jgi:hypothetical protein
MLKNIMGTSILIHRKFFSFHNKMKLSCKLVQKFRVRIGSLGLVLDLG